MRKPTVYDLNMKNSLAVDDGRLKGGGHWEKYPFFWFLLFLSYKCTRKCDYCYAFNQVGFENEAEMDEPTFSRLLEWIPEIWRQNNVKNNVIVFLGGEPLMRTDRVRRVMEAANKGTGGMQGNLSTNADLVDSVEWDDLDDIHWITTNATDTGIAELGRRMRLIGERANVINQTVAATLDDFNLKRATELAAFGIENGYRFRFNRNLFKGVDEEYKARLLKKYHEICDVLESFKARGYAVRTPFLLDSLIPTWDQDVSPYHCGRRSATVYPDGSIGPCIRNQNFKSASIFSPDSLAKLQCSTFHMDFIDSDLPGECVKCESRLVCQGGCPNDKLMLTGTRRGKSVMCEVHKEIIPRLKALEA